MSDPSPRSSAWALSLDPALTPALGTLLGRRGIEVCRTDDALWLRGSRRDAELERELRALPADARFDVVDGQRRPWGQRLPRGPLPAGDWRRLEDWLKLSLPASQEPTPWPLPLILRLRPARIDEGPVPEPGLLHLPLARLSDWARTTPAIRLRGLSFAASQNGEALVQARGPAPLPPLPGQRLSLAGAIAVPLGWALVPRLDAPSASLVLGLLPGELTVFQAPAASERSDEQGVVASWERIPAQAFRPVSRPALAATVRAVAEAEFETEGGD